ncbi:MAG: ATP-binding protein [Clostridiales bacterium]|nr:ATP-binding protein [Clostridiales bacterium]
MRIIPKKIKVKNTVWKCYSMVDIIVALIVFAIIFIAVTAKNWAFAAIMGIAAIVLLMPTQDGIFYSCIFENIKFLFAKKHYTLTAKNAKENIDTLIGLKEIRENGLLAYNGGTFGRVIKVGQKNFGIEDTAEQNIDINYLANALKLLDGTQSADIVKIDRPVTLDNFSADLFDKLTAMQNGDEQSEVKAIKANILRERIDRIDRMNNIRKQYISDYYIVVYGKNEIDLENTAINIAADINKCGLSTKMLGNRETAVFLKYSYSRDFDEREVADIESDKLTEWVKPKDIEFRANKYIIDGLEAAVLSVAEYPLRVKNAWGAELFNIPNTKVVMHVKPVDKFKAIKRIDKCIGEMETKQILSEKASESNSAETHRDTMNSLLDSLQTENESLLDVTLTVTAYNYLSDENYKKNVRRAMLTGNFKPSMLYGLQIEGFKSANISPMSTLSKYERGINSSSLAAVFPFVRTCVMDEGGIMLGENRTNGYPFIFNLWKRGDLYQNSNAMIIGKSGSGKSFFLKNLILNEWANGTRVVVLDPEAEYLALTRNLYGNIIDVGNAKEGRINPFHIYKVLTEEGTPADSTVTFNTHLKTLESFFKIVLADAPKDVIELINNLAVETYERMGITENTDCSDFTADRFPLFSDLLDTLQAKDKENLDALTLRDMRTAELYLQKFVAGRYSDIWNAPSTLTTQANLIDFNFQSLFANKNNVVANAQMLLVFRFIEQEVINAREANKSGKNLRTMIVCDEAHLFIDAKFPIALDFFYSMSKRIRKYGGSFIPATQNIADWNANEELRGKTSAIIKNSQYTFIFKLSAPDMKDVLDVYSAGDSFNQEEQRMIISAVTGQAFFIGSTELRACIRITAGEYMQDLFNEEIKKEDEQFED